MIAWLIAMVVALALILASPTERGQKLRVWGIMVAGLPAEFIYPNVWTHLAIDLVIAAVVMLSPKTAWQRAIGLCYVGMELLTMGYILSDFAALYNFSSATNNHAMLTSAHNYLGWAATAFLITWGANGVARRYWTRTGAGGDLRAVEQGRVR